MKNIDYKKGIRFKCQGSAKCCVSRGSYGFVYLSKKDIKRLSDYTSLKIYEFINLYCDKTEGFTHLKEKNKLGNCLFLDNNSCSVYNARPTQCRTWPFWPENIKSKNWKENITKFCPGIGKGKIITKIEIQKQIKEEENNEKNILKDSA